MKKLQFVFLLAAISFLFNSCRKVTGEGPVVTENRTVNNFTSLSTRVSADVNYTPANEFRLEIMAQRNILDLIETPVINNELVIRFKNNVIVRRHEDVIINISAPALTGLKVSGSGNLRTLGDYKPSSLYLDISGSGDIEVQNLVTGTVEANISGSGKMKVNSGTATDETLKISGSGSIDLLNVNGRSANTTTSGSGTTRINVSDNLHAKISGSGNVYYKGSPAVTLSVSGSGKIIHL